MKNVILLLCFLCLFIQLPGQTPPDIDRRYPLTIGETIELTSASLQEERVLNIYLPLSYDPDSLNTYPVIYLLDGTLSEDFIHIAGLVQFGSFSWINMLPETIVVGIANIDRKRDFTYPSRLPDEQEAFPTTGGAAAFIDFIEREVQPLIEATYRTNGTSTLIGQSLGGLLATEILFRKPDMFDNYIIVSPSLWWDDFSTLERTPESYTSQKSIFVAVGEEGRTMKRVAKQLYKKLKAIQGANTRLHYTFLPDQDHGDALHQAAYRAFEWMFGEGY